MRTVRWAAATATILMSLMNLPFAVDNGGAGLPSVLNWLISLLGVVGIVSALGLLRHAGWGRPAVLAVGAINLVGAVLALVAGLEGAIIGLVVSVCIVILGLLTRSGDGARVPASSPSM
ncbi:MAG TPA: hypothetical protein VIT41_01295 [Microlunatus sp.]